MNVMSVELRRRTYSESRTPRWLPLLILFPPLLPCFRRYSVVLEGDELTFGYNCRLTRQTVCIADIELVVTQSAVRPICDWLGYGIRRNCLGHIGYIVDGGPALTIVVRSGSARQTYVFNCEDTAELRRMLHEHPVTNL